MKLRLNLGFNLTKLTLTFVSDVGLVSTLLEEKENRNITTSQSTKSVLSGFDEITLPPATVVDSQTTLSTITENAELETTTKVLTTISAEVTKTTAVTPHITRATTTLKPEPKIKITKSNSTLILLKKGNNGTEFVIEGVKFQHPKEVLEVISPPDLRNKEKKGGRKNSPVVFEDPPTKPLTTPRGFHYSPTVPLVARLQAERADTTTSPYNDTSGLFIFFIIVKISTRGSLRAISIAVAILWMGM